MPTHPTSSLSSGFASADYMFSSEVVDKAAEKRNPPQEQANPFSSSVPSDARSPSEAPAPSVPSPSSRTVRSATGNSAATPDSQATESTIAAQEQRLKEGLASSSRNAQSLITRAPTFSQAAAKKLFPNATQPVDLNQWYVNDYVEDVVSTGGDYGGFATVKRRQTASYKLTDLLSESIKFGGALRFLDHASERGIFSRKDSVAYGDALGGVSMSNFRDRLDELARNPASALQDDIDNYFEAPSAIGSASPFVANAKPKTSLRLDLLSEIAGEANLRAIADTLKPEHKALIDYALANPNPSAEQRAQSNAPAMYGISVITTSTPVPGVTLPGAFLITGSHPVSDRTPSVFYSPIRGIQTFDSLQDFQDHVLKQSQQDLLGSLSNENAAKLAPRLDGLHLGVNQLEEDIFSYSIKTQVERYKSDIAHAFKQAKEKGITDLNDLDLIASNSSVPLRASFDDNLIDARNLAAKIEHGRPAWWKNATETDRVQLDRLEQDARAKADSLAERMKALPAVATYAAQQIKKSLQEKYPNAEIDPDAITVSAWPAIRADAHNRRPRPGSFPLPAPSQGSPPSVSLTQFVLNNVRSNSGEFADPIASLQYSARFTDKDGKQITLSNSELRSLARDLNIGDRHQRLIKQHFLSDESNDLRQGWVDSYVAHMRADAKVAQLSKALDSTAYDQVLVLVDNPDGLGRNDEPLQTYSLRIGNSTGGRRGAELAGPLLIAKKNAKPTDPLTLYTPHAPGDVEYRTYPNGMTDLNRDAQLKGSEWETYFKNHVFQNHVSEDMKSFLDAQFTRGYNLFDRVKNENSSFREVVNTLYENHVRQQLTDTQSFSKANQQHDHEARADWISLAMGMVTAAADFAAPGPGAMKFLKRLRDPFKAIVRLKERIKPSFVSPQRVNGYIGYPWSPMNSQPGGAPPPKRIRPAQPISSDTQQSSSSKAATRPSSATGGISSNARSTGFHENTTLLDDKACARLHILKQSRISNKPEEGTSNIFKVYNGDESLYPGKSMNFYVNKSGDDYYPSIRTNGAQWENFSSDQIQAYLSKALEGMGNDVEKFKFLRKMQSGEVLQKPYQIRHQAGLEEARRHVPGTSAAIPEASAGMPTISRGTSRFTDWFIPGKHGSKQYARYNDSSAMRGVSTDPNWANATLIDKNGSVKETGKWWSGGTSHDPASRAGYQSDHLHSEMKLLYDLKEKMNKGDGLIITGKNPPCNHCKSEIKKYAKDKDITIMYQWHTKNGWETFTANDTDAWTNHSQKFSA